MREEDHGLDHRACVLVREYVADEGSIDLQLAEGHQVELFQRGIAGTEIIDREAEVLHAHAREHVHRGAWIEHRRALGHLENDATRIGTDLGGHSCDLVREGQIIQQLRRKIHRDRQVQADRIPGATLRQRNLQHMFRELADQSVAFSDGNEAGG